MAQERYFDYRSEIKSKKSAEHGAILQGVGPVYGFDGFEVNLSSRVLTLKSQSPTTIEELNTKAYDKVRYITNENNNFKPVQGAVVTLDGILSVWDEAVAIDMPQNLVQQIQASLSSGNPLSSYFAMYIVARHNYIASSSPVATTLVMVDYESNLGGGGGNNPRLIWKGDMSNWFKVFGSKTGFNPTTDTIVGMYVLETKAGSIVTEHIETGNDWEYISNKGLCPYNYEWPNRKVVSQIMWDKANTPSVWEFYLDSSDAATITAVVGGSINAVQSSGEINSQPFLSPQLSNFRNKVLLTLISEEHKTDYNKTTWNFKARIPVQMRVPNPYSSTGSYTYSTQYLEDLNMGEVFSKITEITGSRFSQSGLHCISAQAKVRYYAGPWSNNPVTYNQSSYNMNVPDVTINLDVSNTNYGLDNLRLSWMLREDSRSGNPSWSGSNYVGLGMYYLVDIDITFDIDFYP